VVTPDPVSVPAPIVSLSTNSIEFGSEDVGAISAPARVVINNSGTAPFTISRLAVSARGDGLLATYYNDVSLSRTATQRVDQNIDFSWGGGSPDSTVNTDQFSVRWTGLIEPDYSEDYTFYTSTDDGVRLWIDGKLIIDHWINQSEQEYSGVIHLTAGTKYLITMEYFDNTGGATARLSWSSNSQQKTVVPKDNLYSVTDTAMLQSTISDFSQTNNCNNFVPAGASCTVNVQFIPTTSGISTGSLTVAGSATPAAYLVRLSGTGSTGVVATPPPSGSVSAPPPSGTVLHVDFNSHPGGAYTKQDAMRDFNANESTESVDLNNTSVVNDPSGDPSRGKVMQVTHLAGMGGGNGGFRFKARFPAADEYYLAFDIFIPNNYELISAEKLPGLMYGTLLDASHGSGVKPIPEGVKAFSVMHQLLGIEAYPGRGEGKLTSYVYDADRVQYDEFFDVVNPANSPSATTWHLPKGQWVRIEQRIRQNTATSQEGVGDKADGILQEWINGKLAVDKRKHFRTVDTMHIDGIYMYSYYGGKSTDPINKPNQTQNEYYDNFIVSTSPITH
jgi:hypothetical protein